jgi:hypothetical protein
LSISTHAVHRAVGPVTMNSSSCCVLRARVRG